MATGTAAATLELVSNAYGEVSTVITGTAAATIRLIGGDLASEVNFRYTSRAVPFVPERDKACEVIFANVKCEFNDSLTFDITIKTDKERYKSTVSYPTNERVVNNQTAAGRPYFRKFVEAVPAPGCFGYFFQAEVDKKTHYLNGFEFTGVNFYAVERKGIGPEFIAGGATLLNGWE